MTIPRRRRRACFDTLHSRYKQHIGSDQDPQGKAAERIAQLGEDNICTSIIVEDLLDEIAILPFDAPADVEYGDIRLTLEAAGRPIGSNDLLIAAQARATGATVVTANASEFKRVRGLNVENWLA